MPLFKAEQKFGEGLHMDRWSVVRKIGEGQFAEVYEVKDLFSKEDKRFAIKLEKRREKTSVRAEAKVLRKLQDCCGICKMLDTGTYREHFYIQMELLGMNLAELRRERNSGFSSDGKCSVEDMCVIGLSLMKPLRAMHEAGYIHRDVKPANFVALKGELDCAKANFRMIDFGLSRRFVDDDGQPLPERHDTAFRGSTTYASVHAHHEQDLSRRDDLWSWFYILVEMVDGTLPWRRERDDAHEVDREQVLRTKESCIETPAGLTSTVALPEELATISDYLSTLEFDTEPDYSLLEHCLGGDAAQTPPFPTGPADGQKRELQHTAASHDGSARGYRSENYHRPDDSSAPRRGDAPSDTHRDTERDAPRRDQDGYDRDRDRDYQTRRDRGSHDDSERDRERDRDRERERERDRERDRADYDRGRDRDRDRYYSRGSDRERDHDYRGADRDRPPHREREGSAAYQQRHDKEPSTRDRDDRSRDAAQPSAKRGRYAEDNSSGGGSDAVRGTSWRDLHDRDSRKDEPRKKASEAAVTADKPREALAEHACHTSRVSEVRDVIRIVSDGTGPSGGEAGRVAESLAHLSAGEALGSIGLVIESLVSNTLPADAEVVARWLEALSCYTGDAAASVWERYLQQDTAGGSK
mmetsp:Transcript_28568/g.80539  ORF Transcript_28568/g.80539 Transcript_28568/m.80539 type:complete len:640 (+) Transcript_28568:506-2425(+)|eukprot:CAMPEP_0117660496 /NCGR_PEP_ID=MMETSP0804-20121206/6999_1 /TAXON_ID=1074897 /ORGANISM="Tetraselmis astigmatica, Strain CCMP880" /LENGTH=639 /DNA_ID=CAMNT_0005467229 /DNA_START=491 /DNA_END=2410 /DNA_ORIENTATION=+